MCTMYQSKQGDACPQEVLNLTHSLSPMESVFLFLLFHLPGSSSEGFTYHQRTPAISSTTTNPARYSGDVGSIKLRKALSKAHGILMIVAWPWLTGTAMLFAAFLKPVLKKGKWFQVWRDKKL